MLNLKSSLILLYIFICACQSTRSFELKTFHTSVDDLHVIEVSSSRVRQKCLFLNAEAENQWRHQYVMHVLDENNNALEIIHPINQDKDSCHEQMLAIEKLLGSESKVRLCVRDSLKKKSLGALRDRERFVQFGSLGTHRIAYETLTLDSICGSKKCVGNNSAWVNTCPGFVKH